MYLVLRKIDLTELKKSAADINIFYLAAGFLVFNLGQIVSSVRLNLFFKSCKVHLSETQNIILYYTGMFYNLFLPGGIGGDGYKVYLLKKKGGKVMDLTRAVLFDRLSGLTAIGAISCLIFPFGSFAFIGKTKLILLSILVLASGLVIYYFLLRYLFLKAVDVYSQTIGYSLIIQILQIVAAILIVKAIGIHAECADLIILFLASSIAAAIPVTFGGIGSRELVFLYGFEYLGLVTSLGVAFTLMFFMITAVSSFAGVFLLGKAKEIGHS